MKVRYKALILLLPFAALWYFSSLFATGYFVLFLVPLTILSLGLKIKRWIS